MGFLIFAGWFVLLWASVSFLTDRCGMVDRYAYPCALIIAGAAATIAVYVCFKLNWAGWIALVTLFVYVCMSICG